MSINEHYRLLKQNMIKIVDDVEYNKYNNKIS